MDTELICSQEPKQRNKTPTRWGATAQTPSTKVRSPKGMEQETDCCKSKKLAKTRARGKLKIKKKSRKERTMVRVMREKKS